jgi:hypothetical protein
MPTKGASNSTFLKRLRKKAKEEIIDDICRSYKISQADALAMITSPDAKGLPFYLAEPIKSVTYTRMRQDGLI